MAHPELLFPFPPPPPAQKKTHRTASDASVLSTIPGWRRLLVGDISENADTRVLEMMLYPVSTMPQPRSGKDGSLIAHTYSSRRRQLPLPRSSLITSLLLVCFCFVQISIQDRDPLKDFCRRFGHQTAVIDRKLYIDGGLIDWNPIAQYPANYSSKFCLVRQFTRMLVCPVLSLSCPCMPLVQCCIE